MITTRGRGATLTNRSQEPWGRSHSAFTAGPTRSPPLALRRSRRTDAISKPPRRRAERAVVDKALQLFSAALTHGAGASTSCAPGSFDDTEHVVAVIDKTTAK